MKLESVKNAVTQLFVVLALLALVGCAAKPKPATPPPQPTQPERPEWTMNEPEVEAGVMSFVGLSAVHASEKNAREDARRNAVDAVVQYLGTLAKTKFEQASVSYGLSSEVVDPTTSSRNFQKQVAANVARRLKTKKWYMERESDASGKQGYKYFVLSTVPVAEMDKAFQQTAKKNMEDAQKKAKEATTAQAKQQQEQAANFWADMQKQGVVE
jgi:hypothetical protein|tara:strand:+ start:279 stop:917 length:639 start_codon:yes stop_codon:yes gene_type:complete